MYWVLYYNLDSVSDTEEILQKLDNVHSAAHAMYMLEPWHADIRSLRENQDVLSSPTLTFYGCFPETLNRECATLIKSPASTEVTLLRDEVHPSHASRRGRWCQFCFSRSGRLLVWFGQSIRHF
jgi:hypothetical protein